MKVNGKDSPKWKINNVPNHQPAINVVEKWDPYSHLLRGCACDRVQSGYAGYLSGVAATENWPLMTLINVDIIGLNWV